MEIQEIINKNYDSIVKRGLINGKTNFDDFIEKLREEVTELEQAGKEFIKVSNRVNSDHMDEELADVILTALNYAHHYGIDIEKELIKKIKKNELRGISRK